MALSLRTLRGACLLFVTDPAVPFTKPAQRMAKVHMKIAGCFRTQAEAERFAHMQGLVETARKRGQNLLDLLRQDLDVSAPQLNPIPP